MGNENIGMSLRLKVVLGILVLIAVFFVFRAVSYLHAQTQTATISVSTHEDGSNVISQYSSPMLDSDHDGIPDVQEASYGTDPIKPDTDSDGYLDGEEIAAATDPIVNEVTAKKNAQNNTLTTRFFDKLVGGYMAGDLNYKTAGTDAFTNGMDTLVYATIDDFNKSKPAVTVPDPAINDDSSPEAIKKYLTDVTVLLNIIPADGSYYTGSMTADATSLDRQSVKRMYMLALVLDRVSKKLSLVPAPRDMAGWQSQMTRTMANLSQIYYALVSVDQDPIRAMAELDSFTDTFTNFSVLGAQFNGILEHNGLPVRVRAFAIIQQP